MQINFQDGVDSIYDACVAKGSTPASYSLSDVVAGIMAIPSGITLNDINRSLTTGNSMYIICIYTFTNLSMNSFPCQGYKTIALYYTCGSHQYDKYVVFYTASGTQLGSHITLAAGTWNILSIPTGSAICGIYFRTYGDSVAYTYYALYS